MKNLIKNKEGEKLFLSANEAIVRGAIEADVNFVTTYPGTPASEIGDTFYKIKNNFDMYFEYSINEKVALEIAASASLSGLRSLCAMKHVGLNVAADMFMSLPYVGVEGGLVIITADDPYCHSSQNEQDNRYYAKMANIPMLEPTSPQEAKDMIKEAFSLSEDLRLPVLLRTTTRINHSRGIVDSYMVTRRKKKGYYQKQPSNHLLIPSVARKQHKVLIEKMERAKGITENSLFNKILGNGKFGVITSGASYPLIMQTMTDLNIENEISILRLGVTNPLPVKLCKGFLERSERILIVEELEPFLEDQIKALAFDFKIDVQVLGKNFSRFSKLYEYNMNTVKRAILDFIGLTYNKIKTLKPYPNTPQRYPTLCPGCPHSAAFHTVKAAIGDNSKYIFSSDIGCYTLGFTEPFKMADINFCMGSSIGVASGFAKSTEQQVISFIGDSTFLHAGIPELINAVANNYKFVLFILNNQTTAMTGFQPHPGTALHKCFLESIVKACGVEFVELIDSGNLVKSVGVIKKALSHNKISVVISTGACIHLRKRDSYYMVNKKDAYFVCKNIQDNGEEKRYKLLCSLNLNQYIKACFFCNNYKKCNNCNNCIDNFFCPAFKTDNGNIYIDKVLCSGCGSCSQICENKAIQKVV